MDVAARGVPDRVDGLTERDDVIGQRAAHAAFDLVGFAEVDDPGIEPRLCRIPTAPSSRVTSHMSADIIIGCTISTGGPTGDWPGRLSGGKYRRSLYIGTLSTIWDGDGTVPVSKPPVARLPARSAR